MASGNQGDDDEIITAINVTPLVDVVLVLLIILMVTATAIVSRTIPMELPEASDSENTPMTETLAISIDAEGTLFLDAIEMDEATLRTRVRAARRGNEDLKAVIAADGSVQHRNVVRVIDLLRTEDVNKFAINVRPSELQ